MLREQRPTSCAERVTQSVKWQFEPRQPMANSWQFARFLNEILPGFSREGNFNNYLTRTELYRALSYYEKYQYKSLTINFYLLQLVKQNFRWTRDVTTGCYPRLNRQDVQMHLRASTIFKWWRRQILFKDGIYRLLSKRLSELVCFHKSTLF